MHDSDETVIGICFFLCFSTASHFLCLFCHFFALGGFPNVGMLFLICDLMAVDDLFMLIAIKKQRWTVYIKTVK